METSLKTGFAQIFSCCPKNLSCPNFGGAAAPLAPPARTPMPMDNLIVIPHSLHLPDQYGQASDVIIITTEVKSRTFFFSL